MNRLATERGVKCATPREVSAERAGTRRRTGRLGAGTAHPPSAGSGSDGRCGYAPGEVERQTSRAVRRGHAQHSRPARRHDNSSRHRSHTCAVAEELVQRGRQRLRGDRRAGHVRGCAGLQGRRSAASDLLTAGDAGAGEWDRERRMGIRARSSAVIGDDAGVAFDRDADAGSPSTGTKWMVSTPTFSATPRSTSAPDRREAACSGHKPSDEYPRMPTSLQATRSILDCASSPVSL